MLVKYQLRQPVLILLLGRLAGSKLFPAPVKICALAQLSDVSWLILPSCPPACRQLSGRSVNQSLQYRPTEDDEVEDLFLLLKEVKVG